MKYINLNLDFGVDRVRDPKCEPDTVLALNWIENTVVNGFRNGLKADQRRMFDSLRVKIEKARKEGAQFLQLNPVEYVFVKSGFDASSVSPQEAKYVTLVENAIFAATDTIPEVPVETPVGATNDDPTPSGEQNTGPTPETVAPGGQPTNA